MDCRFCFANNGIIYVHQFELLAELSALEGLVLVAKT
jgi:hypothetical protein